MRTRKTSLLKWMAIVELVMGAYNLMTGLMSAYVLITDLEGVKSAFAEQGIAYSVSVLGISVALTTIGGLVMTVAGGLCMGFGTLPGRQKLPVYCGYMLFAYVILSDIVQIAFVDAVLSPSMLFPFLLHGLFMWGAVKNKKELDAAEE